MKKILLFALFFFIFVGLLIRNSLYQKVLFLDWDEGMYAQIARELIRNKSLITTFNGEMWFDKPPLSHLLIALSFLLFGESEFYSRLMMSVLSLFLLFLLFLLTKKLFKSTAASLINVLLLSASPIFLERATMLNSDLLVAISWLGYFVFWENYWLKLIFLTIGVWSKSVLGFYPLFFETIYCLFHIKTLKTKINKKNVFYIFLFIIIPSTWYLFLFLKFGQIFVTHHFLSQMFKRLYVPIELHFGNKFFYFNYLWKTFGFINLFFIFGYLNLIKNWKKEIKNLKRMLILISPLPFLALLTIMKTKIDWYVIIFLPLLNLSLSYVYLRYKSVILKIFILISVGIYFILNFLPQTFFLKINYLKPEKIDLALCLNKKEFKKLAFFVDDQERKNRQFLEAAHYNTTSSFYYGGSPSFVYYLNKPVKFFYKTEFENNELVNFDIIALSRADYQSFQDKIKQKNPVCQTKNWLVFELK